MRLDDRKLNIPIELDRLMTNPVLISLVAAEGFEMLDVQRGDGDYDSLSPIPPLSPIIVRGDKPTPLNYTRQDHSSKVRHINPKSYQL